MCGGLYLVQHNHELAEHWKIGEEIDTWEDLPDLVTKVVWYLVNPAKCEDMRHRAAERARRDHTWRKRFERAFDEMGLNMVNYPTGMSGTLVTTRRRPRRARTCRYTGRWTNGPNDTGGLGGTSTRTAGPIAL